MKNVKKVCKVAVIQAAPVMFDKDAHTQKVVDSIQGVSRKGAQLMVFLKLFVPSCPYGMTFGSRVGNRDGEGRQDWKLYLNNSILVPGKETEKIGTAAREAGAYVGIGASKQDGVTGALYNINLLFSPRGSLVRVHRKLKPTGTERTVWGSTDRGYFPVKDTPWGVMEGLICWESYVPLAKAALYGKEVALYISPNINDNPEWRPTVQHTVLEGRCYFINCNIYITRDMYPENLCYRDETDGLPDMVCREGSYTVDPYGHYMTEPVWGKGAVIYADLGMDRVGTNRIEFDVYGHYSRPDVLRLQTDDG